VAAVGEKVRLVVRLISFLGTGNYGETTYAFDGKTRQTRYVAQALASFMHPNEIRVIATTEAWSEHGDALAQKLSDIGQPAPEQILIPTGGESHHLWQMFSVIVEVLRTSKSSVLLDITHGFRMQPFFAASCIEYVQAVLSDPPPIRVVYGEYRKDEVESPVWELTPFLDVLSWSRSLMMFLQTGQAEAVVEPTKRLACDLLKQWAISGKQGPQPQLRMLSNAIQKFGDDLTTIRTGSLLLGEQGSARQLATVIDQTRSDVEQHLPALAFVLEQVHKIVAPLCGDGRLSASSGQRLLLSLARLYQEMGRYSESISVLREGWITLGAPSTADHPGTEEFDNSLREVRDREWSRRNGELPDPVSEIRNDIQHAGFKKQPHDKKWFATQLDCLLNKWELEIKKAEPTPTSIK
jgi:CRISPR-associated protein Csx16